MKKLFGHGEKRKYPRFMIDLPLEYREVGNLSYSRRDCH